MKYFFSLLFHGKFRALFFEPTNDGFVQFFRSVFVGGIATVFDFGVTALVRELFFASESNINNLISSGCGFIIGLAVNFALSCIFVFSKSKLGRVREFVIFAAIGIVGLLLNTGILQLLNLIGMGVGLLFYISKIIATLITLIWNFSARKLIIYRKNNLTTEAESK